MSNLLVIGGAGYIGSNLAALALTEGHTVTVLDNLATGHREAVPERAHFVAGNMADRALLRDLFRNETFDAVLHFAASSLVGESVTDPAKYYENNVGATIALLQEMRHASLNRLVFSSSAATFGQPSTMPITEETPQNPINPYGRSKLMVEQILRDFHTAYGLNSVSLRYFNAAGVYASYGEDHRPETHLIPNILAVPLGQKDTVLIFGRNYPTPDGTAVRDFIHVEDLAHVHLKALEYTKKSMGFFNIGSGAGYSVSEVIAMSREVTKHDIPTIDEERRAGDPPVLVASSALAERELQWTAKLTLRDIVTSAWEWRRRFPTGYAP